jgi:aminopeptidase N
VQVNGLDVTWSTTGDQLHVALPEPPPPTTTVFEIVTTYSATPRNGLHFRRPGPDSPDTYREAWTQGEQHEHRYWFPSWDEPTDRFTFSAHYTVPTGLSAISNGELRKKDEQGEWTTWHWDLGEHRIVNYLVGLAVGPYKLLEDSWNGVPIQTWYPPDADEASVRTVAGRLPRMMEILGRVTGQPYPYPNYKQVFVQRFLWGGMENTTVTIMDRRYLHPPALAEHRPRGEVVVAHELAHQWFGDLLTCAGFRELWLNEGFAEYFERLVSAELGSPEHAARIHLNSASRAGRSKAPMVLRYWNHDEGARAADPYSRGSAVLHTLRGLLGDEVFFAGIAEYVRRHQDGLVETADLRRAFEDSSGLSLRWFFDQWVYEGGHPELTVKHKVDADAGTLRVDIKQGGAPVRALAVDVLVVTTDGEASHRVWVEDTQAAAVLPLHGELRYVAVDPDGMLLASIEQTQGPAELVAQIGSERPAVRLRALEAAVGKGKPAPAVREAVVALLADPAADPDLRQAAATTLAKWKDDEARAALLAALQAARQGGHGMVREHLTRQLGEVEPSVEVITELADVLAKDPVPDVRGAALGSLASLEGSGVRARALAVLGRLRTPFTRAGDPDFVVEAAAATALGSFGEPGDEASLKALRRGTTHRSLRGAALTASVRLVERYEPGRDRDDARKPVARDLERLLADSNTRARSFALRLLPEVGDRESIRALEANRSLETSRSLIEAYDDAIAQIRKRRDGPVEPRDGEVRATLEKLEERLERLQKEVTELQERH